MTDINLTISNKPQKALDLSDLPDAPPDFSDLPDATPSKSEIANPVHNVATSAPTGNTSGMLSNIWDKINQPLTDLPSRAAKYITSLPSADSSSIPEGLQSADKVMMDFQGRGLQTAGDIASGLTSPLNIAMTAATAGENVANPLISKIAQYGARALSVPVTGEGIKNVVTAPTIGGKALGALEAIGGIFGMRGRSPRVSGETPKFTSSIPNDVTKAEMDAAGPGINPNISQSNLIKRKLKLNGDGTFTDLGTGEIIDKSGKAVTPKSEVPPAPVTGIAPKFSSPRRLARANEITSARIKGPERMKQIQASTEYNALPPDKQTNYLREQLTKEGYDVPPPREPPSSGGEPPIPPEKKVGPLVDKKNPSKLVEAFNLPRALKASMDLSAPLRQGIGLIHKKEFWKSLYPMIRAAGSENYYRGIMQQIAEKPLFKMGMDGSPSFAAQMGLKLTDLTSLSNREEALMSTWAEKVPLVRGSNRAYTAFLDKLRADTFENLVMDNNAKNNIPLAKSLAKFVNVATGRGSLGSLEKVSVELNTLLFSPRLISSRLTILNPAYYINANPIARKETLKSLLAITATGTTVASLAKMAGADVGMDPTSSDFGKIKIGDTRLDPWAGFQQYVVAASRLVSGETTSSTSGKSSNLYSGRYGQPNGLDVVENLAESKLHPTLGFARDMLKGKDFNGKPFNIPKGVAELFIPMIMQDVADIMKSDPNLLPLAIPASLGMGLQTYQKRR